MGVEIGFQKHLGPYYKELADTYPFDFIIGSTHVVDGRDPYNGVLFENQTDAKVYERAFEETMENIRIIRDFDVLGTHGLYCGTADTRQRSITGKTAQI